MYAIRSYYDAAFKNYKPNSIAKNLKNQRTNTLGVILPNILNPFFAKVFSGIEKKAIELGYNVITGISNESCQKEKQVIEMLNNGTIDGFILSVAEETQALKDYDHLNNVIKWGTPIVMFDRVVDEVVCDVITSYSIHYTKLYEVDMVSTFERTFFIESRSSLFSIFRSSSVSRAIINCRLLLIL